MKFEDVVEEFINWIEQEKNGKTSITYQRKIYVFYEFVVFELQAKDVNFQSILTGMSIEQLLKALQYYVEKYDIKYAATARNYFTVIGRFYAFISDKYGWGNSLFEKASENAELKVAYENKIKNLKLNTKEQVSPLSDTEAEQLLKLCNHYINDTNDTDILNGSYNGVFSTYISSLTCKLVLLYGTKNATINELKLDNYNDNLNKLNINGFWVHLPDEFAIQMQHYVKDIRSKIVTDKSNERLFVDIMKSTEEIDYSKMFFVLKEVTGNTKATAIAKYSIMQMIRLGLPSHVIKEFTGYANDVYNYCSERVDEEDGIMMMNEKCKLLDSSFRKVKFYDIM